MAFRWRLLIIFLALTFSGVRSFAASQAAAERAFSSAENQFQSEFWERAEEQFADFAQRFRTSPRVPEAILFQAEARLKLNQMKDAIALLSANRSSAGKFADQYSYWIAEAHFQNSNYTTAADEFHRLTENFPDFPLRLDACVAEAVARARLEQWPQVAGLLRQTNGVFQSVARSGVTNELLARGYLLLGEAELTQADFGGVEAASQALNSQPLTPELNWRRQYLQCRLKRARGELEEASQDATNLVALANVANQPELKAETATFQASLFEQLQKTDEAIAAYKRNFAEKIPAEQQRRALLKVTELLLTQNKTAEAAETLEKFLAQFPKAEAADTALLTLGELQLKRSLARPDTNQAGLQTNLLADALSRFDSLLVEFPHSSLAEKAMLDKGWCLWSSGKIDESLDSFRRATGMLPLSADQAVARFKWADAQFAMRDFSGAIENYEAVVAEYDSVPEVNERLAEPALYQIVRAALESGETTSATSALRKILDWFPDSFAGPHSLLLVGQDYAQRQDTAGARELFKDFEKRYPKDSLLPEVGLAVARTYELEKQWAASIAQYESWLAQFTNGVQRPQAEYYRAWDYFMAARETNAFMLFTNFVAQFPTNDLSPMAQWWIADYFFRQGDFQNAEANYQLVYKHWPASELAFEAQMMAGRAAVARLGYSDAIQYFTNLTSSANCPPELYVQALFAYGDALRSMDSGETNHVANLRKAIQVFGEISKKFPDSAQESLAWGEIGNCYKELGATDALQYDEAAKFYERAFSSPQATVEARNEARIGLGIVAEKLALQTNGVAQAALFKVALNHYLDVFFGNKLPDGQISSAFWVKKSGLEAGRLAEALQDWPTMERVYRELQRLLPALRQMCEKKILKAQEQQNLIQQ